ncbi:helix-turn-helix domain-containing protein [Actinokineospora bangkokensis]|uniref:Uncharacterized protein n=1 Tax=Actinokineospora bangkokensis TaxID=1193682 RepID=A0A1Q9LML5_9PSEU|nr:helix-turn-helix domain-containing protein [Actinokineospora bangkokensis]OLR93270.1 hypothetical protein BJP25_17460 [Actinokineospora bangkokensis]
MTAILDRQAALRAEVVEALRPGTPAPALLDPLVEVVRTAVAGCVQAIAHPDEWDAEEWSALFRARWATLPDGDDTARAYRVGARVAWRVATEVAQRGGAPAEDVLRATEVLFTYLAAAGECGSPAVSRAVARQRLMGLLLADPPAGRAQVAEVAAEAGWEVPEQVRVVALRRVPDEDRRGHADLGPEALLDLDGPHPCAVVPATRCHRAALAAALPGWRAAISPAVATGHAARGLRTAVRALDLVARGRLPQDPVLDCEDHLLPLALFTDEFLIEALAEDLLAPLAPLRAYQRNRYLATLDQWFATRGRVAEMADRLGVHQQTVRYRLTRLTELFGDRLEDPRRRFELELAVRARLRHRR